jgi:hypothetical protein
VIIHRRRGPPSSGAADLSRGETLAGYRIERPLGHGGMGTVYEATQLSLGRRVALKVIAPGIPIDEALRARFRREGPLQAVIDHPHILPVYEAGDDGGRLFIATRLVRGQTLKALAASRSLGQDSALRILTDIGEALDTAHAAGLIHRDVKPQNILVGAGDYAYLADFGLSKGRGEDTVTRPGELLGSISYISPEQVRGEPATAASDIYSFTCVVYECLVGIVPFPRESDHAVLHAHVWDPRPCPSEIRPELPAALDAVIARGMAGDPAERPPSARALMRDVAIALGTEPPASVVTLPGTFPLAGVSDDASSTRPGARATPPARTRRRTPLAARLLALLAATLTVVAGGAGGYLAGRTPATTARAKTQPASSARVAPTKAPETRYAGELRTALTALNTTKAAAERKLATARTARGQAAMLAALARAYQGAERAVARARPSARDEGANRALSLALAHLSRGYQRLAAAAAHHSRARYRSGRRALVHEQASLAQAVARLKRQGLTIA